VRAQKAPAAPDKPWDVTPGRQTAAPPRLAPAFAPDPSKVYTLSELVNLAEENNPTTRVAWENAVARAADLGIAKSTLYPTLAAAALAHGGEGGMFRRRRGHGVILGVGVSAGSERRWKSPARASRRPPQRRAAGQLARC